MQTNTIIGVVFRKAIAALMICAVVAFSCTYEVLAATTNLPDGTSKVWLGATSNYQANSLWPTYSHHNLFISNGNGASTETIDQITVNYAGVSDIYSFKIYRCSYPYTNADINPGTGFPYCWTSGGYAYYSNVLAAGQTTFSQTISSAEFGGTVNLSSQFIYVLINYLTPSPSQITANSVSAYENVGSASFRVFGTSNDYLGYDKRDYGFCGDGSRQVASGSDWQDLANSNSTETCDLGTSMNGNGTSCNASCQWASNTPTITVGTSPASTITTQPIITATNASGSYKEKITYRIIPSSQACTTAGNDAVTSVTSNWVVPSGSDTWNVSGLTPGSYKWCARGSDGTVDESTWHEGTFTLTSAPSAPSIDRATGTNAVSNDTTPTFTVTGSFQSNDWVRIYKDGTCSTSAGTAILASTASTVDITTSNPLLNTPNTAYTFSADVERGGTLSACSTSTASYTLDTTAPEVASVTTTETGAKKVGDVIPLKVTFSEVVTVTGVPQLTLETGTTDRAVDYTSGSGSTELIFNYMVQAGDTSADLDYVSTSALSVGTTIKDAAGNDAALTLPTVGTFATANSIIIDTTKPASKLQVNGVDLNSSSWYTSDTQLDMSIVEENQSGVKGRYFCVASNTVPNCTPAPYPNNALRTLTSDGAYKARYYTVDAAENQEDIHEDIIQIDKSASSTPTVTDDGTYAVSTSSLPSNSWSATDSASDIAEYQYCVSTNATDCETGKVVDWISAGTNTSADITSVAGTFTQGTMYYVHVKAKNGAGLWSAVGHSNGITVDTSALSPVITSSAASVTATSPIPVTVTWNRPVADFDVSDLTLGNATAGNFAGSGTSYTFDLTPVGQGVVTVDIASGTTTDENVRANQAATQFSRTYDTTNPAITITDDAGTWTASETVIATVADATALTTKWKYNTNTTCSTTASDYDNTYTSGSTITITTDHTDHICFYAEDAAGNKGTAVTGVLQVDTTTPDIVAITAGASSTDRVSIGNNIPFNAAAAGNDSQISFTWTNPGSNSGDTFYWKLDTNPDATSIAGTVANATDSVTTGSKDAVDISSYGLPGTPAYFHVQPRNGAGTWGTERVYIVNYDTSVPTTPTLTITAGTGADTSKTNTATVAIALADDDDAASWCVQAVTHGSSAPSDSGCTFGSEPTTYTLTDAGNYDLYAWTKNLAGTVSSISTVATIDYSTATPATPTVTFADGSYTNSTTPTLIIGNDATAWKWLISETNTTPSATDAGWTTEPTSVTFGNATNEAKTVYAWVKNVYGTVSSVGSGSVTLDTVAPTGNTIDINGSALLTTDTTLTLATASTDTNTVAQMKVSCNGSTYAPAEAYVTTKSLNLAVNLAFGCTTTDGTKTVYVQYKDLAGNWSTAVSDTITLDATVAAPTVAVTDTDNTTPSGYTKNTAVTVTLTGLDSDTTHYYASETNTLGTPTWVSITDPASVSFAHTLTSSAGAHHLYVWVKDAAGNISTNGSQTITLDTSAPTLGFSRADDSTVTTLTSGAFQTTLTWSESVTGLASDDITTTGGSTVLSGSTLTVTPSGRGDVVISVRAAAVTDGAGRANNLTTVTYHYQPAPTVPANFTTDSGTVSAASQYFILSWDAADGATSYVLKEVNHNPVTSTTLSLTAAACDADSTCSYQIDSSAWSVGTTNAYQVIAVNSAGTSTPTKRVTVQKIDTATATISGGELTKTGSDLTLGSSDAAGRAELPAGVTTVKLDDGKKLDLSSAVSAAVGNTVTINGGAGSDTTLDLTNLTSGALSGVNITTQTVGGEVVNIAKATQLNSGTEGTAITLQSSALTTARVELPDNVLVFAPTGWDGTFAPPKTATATGAAPSGYSFGSTVVETGNSGSTILLDTPASVILDGVFTDVGYLPAGGTTWTRITNVCGGTFAAPTNPTFPGECYITDTGSNQTKIVTYHFTMFSQLVRAVSSAATAAGGAVKSAVVTSYNQVSKHLGKFLADITEKHGIVQSIRSSDGAIADIVAIDHQGAKANFWSRIKDKTVAGLRSVIANLAIGDRLKTNGKGGAELTLSQLSEVRLDKHTDIEVADLAETTDKNVAVKFKHHGGTAWYKFKKVPNRKDIHEIATPSTVSTIRGTSVNVETKPDGTEIITLAEGAVDLQDVITGKVTHIATGESYIHYKDGRTAVVKDGVAEELPAAWSKENYGKDARFEEFTDVSKNDWYYSSVTSLKQLGILSGKAAGRFEPNAQLTRAEALKVALAVANIAPTAKYTGNFTDVSRTAWYAPVIATAVQRGIVRGYGDGTFRPDSPVNRAEIVAMLLAAKQVELPHGSADQIFTDVAPNAWYARYVNYGKAKGIIGGYPDGSFHPDSLVNRAELAKIAAGMMK